jgi:hypothetical protein
VRIPYEVPVPPGREFIELSPDITAAILVTLWAGWASATTSIDVNPEAGEVTITERLRDGMRAVLKAHRYPWSKAMTVLPGTESRSKACVLLPDGRTDIPIFLIEVFLRSEEHDPHAVIECKRIAGGNRHLCREYIVEGVDRFRVGKYGENHAIGFMVGYLLSGSAAEAVVDVNAYLTRKSRQSEHLQPASITADAQSWASQHAREAPSSPITLHHSFFGFSPGMG